MIYMVRRIADKELFGIIESSYFGLFDKVDEFEDPYGFEYSASPFNHLTGSFGHPIMWTRFVYPFKTL